MPLVKLKCSERVPESIKKELAQALTGIVAHALHVEENPDGYLTDSDIEVEVANHGSLDVNVKDIQITVYANEFQERRANLAGRRGEIQHDVILFLDGHSDFPQGVSISGFVWVLLQSASFGEFRGGRRS